MLNRLFYVLLRCAAFIVPYCPHRALYALADFAGTLSYLTLSDIRARVERNFVQAFPDWSQAERRRHVRNAFRNDARNWIDTLRIPSVSNDELRRIVSLHGWDKIEDAVASGRGAIIVTMHLGNFDLVGQLLAARGWNLTVPVERMGHAQTFDFLVRLRASRGIHIVPVEESPRAMLKALTSAQLVGLAIDRVVAGKTLSVPFFGRETGFARGFASLVRHSGVPVFMGVGTRHGISEFEGHVVGPLEMDHTPGPAAERRNTAVVVSEMERFIRRFPDQWMAFWDVWQDGTGHNSPDTLIQRSKAVV